MATLALEYLQFRRIESLIGALKLFEYFKECEVKTIGNVGTGFFLRSRWPGDTKPPPGYFFASGDELTGMTLGLLFLHKALKAHYAGQSSLASLRDAEVRGLTHRLARQLRENHFFIVPPENVGLPIERQTGWSGVYAFEWFFVRAFHSITDGADYSPSSELTNDEWQRMRALPWNGHGEDQVFGDDFLVKQDFSAYERAFWGIYAVGAHMFWGGRTFSTHLKIINVNPSSINPNQIPPGFPRLPVGVPVDIPVSFKVPNFPAHTYPMMLHAFVFGMEGSGGKSEEVTKIRERMSILATAVLTNTAFAVEFPIGKLIDNYVGIPINLISLLTHAGIVIITRDIIVPIGAEKRTPDYYTASIAARYSLLPSAQASLIPTVFAQAEALWSTGLPLSDRFSGGAIADHNPEGKLGSAFAWEKGPNSWVQDGGSDAGDGVINTMISDVIQRNVDVAREGVGLDWMLPTMLAVQALNSNQSADVLHTLQSSYELLLPASWLAGCVANPHNRSENCTYPWPKQVSDRFEPNDIVENARVIGCNALVDLSIDRSTLNSRKDRLRVHPIQALYHIGSQDKKNPVYYCWNTDDIDYFTVDCGAHNRLLVMLRVTSGANLYHRLVVDGIEAPQPKKFDSQTLDSYTEIEVASKALHTIMVTGDTAQYKLFVTPRLTE